MGNIHLVTGYAGQGHVTSADMAALNAAFFGEGQFVLGEGNRLSASVITNNQIRVLDGAILMQGRHIRLNKDTYVDLNIENGKQAFMRNDLIVARYTKNSVTGVEDVNLVVIKGTEVESDPVDPEFTSADILRGEALLNDMPLYRVPINGINVGGLVPLFTLKEVDILDLEANKQDKTGLLGADTSIADNDSMPFHDVSASREKKITWANIKTVLGKVFAPLSHTHVKANITDFPSTMPASDVYAWAKASTKPTYTASEVGAAASSHNHSASNITSGTLPVARGGTGQTNLANLMTQLASSGRGCRVQTGSFVGVGGGNDITITFAFKPKAVLFPVSSNVNNGKTYYYLCNTGASYNDFPVVMIDGLPSSQDSNVVCRNIANSNSATAWYDSSANALHMRSYESGLGVTTSNTYYWIALG